MTLRADPDERLTTGWEPDGDRRDTLLRRYLDAWVAQCDAVVTALDGEVVATDAWTLTDARLPTGLFDAATLRAPLPADPSAAALMLDEIEHAAAGGTGELHLWSAWPTADLRPRGWHLVGYPPLLVRPPAAAAPVPEARPHVDVERRRVTDAAGLAEWERVIVDGYPLTELQPHRPGALAGPALLEDERLVLAVGCDAGEPVSASALFTHDDLGVFALAATVPSARGRGHWFAHARDRLDAAPDRWMVGVFSDHSRPLAQAIGFVPLLRLTLWVRGRH